MVIFHSDVSLPGGIRYPQKQRENEIAENHQSFLRIWSDSWSDWSDWGVTSKIQLSGSLH